MIVRQTATLARTVARCSLVVTDVVLQRLNRALIERLRVTNSCVACTATADRRGQILACVCKQLARDAQAKLALIVAQIYPSVRPSVHLCVCPRQLESMGAL